MSDPYVYPGTDKLVNLAGIRERDVLEAYERGMTLQRYSEGIPGVSLSADGFRAIHRHLFQDVYAWAGRDRTVELAKDESFFCRAAFIADQLDRRFRAIRSDTELANGTAAFAARAAEHVSELNAIHPFREGNGRTLRAFLQVLACSCGHQLDLTRITPDAWHEASVRGFVRGDHTGMTKIIAAALVR
jgi:cell filamentation protein